MLPGIEQYLHALQLPTSQIFSDPVLKKGQVETNALGMPRTRSGNSVLVFKVSSGGHDFAVRCFTRMPADAERRYTAVADAFSTLKHRRFDDDVVLPSAFISEGIQVSGQWHPIIKMAWAKGETLGEFVATHAKSPPHLRRLREALRELDRLLQSRGIAHGDIQPGNLIVTREGEGLVLLDYDGVFVPALTGFQANELGHANFQHPGRQASMFNDRLDRFSFITLELSLRLLEERPALWDETLSDEEGFIFRAHDYADPVHSGNFQKASGVKSLHEATQRFAQICLGPFDAIPTLDAFIESLGERLTPSQAVQFEVLEKASRQAQVAAKKAEVHHQAYVGSYPILFGGHFVKVSHRVGQRIELIGKVVDVRRGKASFNQQRALRPYVYVDLTAISTGKLVRIKLLPDVLEQLDLPPASLPHDGWIGQWVTITEVVQPVQYISHPSFPGGVGEASIHAQHPSQLRIIPEAAARFRLASRDQAPRAGAPTASSAASDTSASASASPPSAAAGLALAPATSHSPRPAHPHDRASDAPLERPKQPIPEALAERMARNRAILEKMKDA